MVHGPDRSLRRLVRCCLRHVPEQQAAPSVANGSGKVVPGNRAVLLLLLIAIQMAGHCESQSLKRQNSLYAPNTSACSSALCLAPFISTTNLLLAHHNSPNQQSILVCSTRFSLLLHILHVILICFLFFPSFPSPLVPSPFLNLCIDKSCSPHTWSMHFPPSLKPVCLTSLPLQSAGE